MNLPETVIGQSRRSSGEATAQSIQQVAIDLFFKQGYRATSLREIAAEVGIQVGSLYNHITSKGDLLFGIMESVMLDLLHEQTSVAQGTAGDVADRIRALIYHHVRFHGQRANEVFIGNSELRSLAPEHRSQIVALRNRYEELLRDQLQEGIDQGLFLPVDVKVTTYGIVAMTTWVSSWYSEGGRLSLEDIADIYADFVLRGLWNPNAGSLADRLDGQRRKV